MTDPGFGDRAYAEADFTPHYVHHPNAPVQFGIGNMLREVYLHAQQHGRVLVQQTYGYDIRSFSADLSRQRAFTVSGSTKFAGVARGWARLPRETTHVVAELVCVLFNLAPAQLELQLVAAGGGHCDSTTSAAAFDADNRSTLLVSNGQLVASSNDFAQAFDAEFPFANVFAVRRAGVVLKLADLDPAAPGTCQLRLEARALRTIDGGTFGVPVALRPLYAVIRADMRWA